MEIKNVILKKCIAMILSLTLVFTMAPMIPGAVKEAHAEIAKTVTKVEVTKEPNKIYYGVGDDFDPTGMIITATFDDGTTADVTDKVVLYNHTDMPLGGTNDIYSVTASYTDENGHTENCNVIVKVREYARYLESIDITKNPDKMVYTEGEYFDPTGMEVTAYYDEGSSEVITGYTYNTEALTTAAPVVLITYTENGIQQGNILDITVNEAEVLPIDAISVNFTLPSAGDEITEPVYTIPADAKYYCGGAVWREETGKYNVTGSFEAGKTYSAVFLIYPNTGETFADPTMITVTANNGDLTGTVAKDGSSMKVVVPFTIPDSGVVTPPHEHTYATEWSKNDTYHWHAATCEHTELKIDYEKHVYGSDGVCKCGAECEHVWSIGNVTKVATCKEPGSKTVYCTVEGCHVSKTETIPVDKNSHPSGSIINLPAKEATCKEPGLTAGEKCSDCGTVTVAQTEIPKLTTHSYDSGKVTKSATCTEAGTKTYTCIDCSATKTETVAKLGHSYSSSYTVDKKATTSANGSKSKHCTVKGCTATASKTTIYKASKVTLSTTSYTYNGKTKKPTVKVYDSKGKTISSSNYTISYASGRKSVGAYKVTVKFKGAYSGSKYATFKINPKGTSISKVTGSKKAMTVKWKKQSGKMASSRIDGYQVRYSTSSKMSGAKTVTIKGYSKTSKKISKLKAKKKYYVQVRTYETVKGVKYYSSWSKIKSVKTK